MNFALGSGRKKRQAAQPPSAILPSPSLSSAIPLPPLRKSYPDIALGAVAARRTVRLSRPSIRTLLLQEKQLHATLHYRYRVSYLVSGQ